MTNIGSLREVLSQFVDVSVKKKALPCLQSFETLDILKTIKGFKYIQTNALIAFDVHSMPYMYSPVQHGECSTSKLVSTYFVRNILYHELQGEAVGGAFAPSCACLLMDPWE